MLSIGEWRPDLPDFQNPGATEAKNVYPGRSSYKPAGSFSSLATTAMSTEAHGFYPAYSGDGYQRQFGGDSSKLYQYNGGWVDASRLAGGAYSGLSVRQWDFATFGSLVVAVNGTDAPQKYTISGAGNFSALGGTPPTANYIATVRDFLVAGGTSAVPNRVQWSAINNAEDWAASATTQSDSQDLPDGGAIQRIVGGDFGVIFQRRAIQRMTYIGSPVIFQFDKITADLGCQVPGSVVKGGEDIFFYSTAGFCLLIGGQQIAFIGRGRVDEYFKSTYNGGSGGYNYLISSAYDTETNRFYLSYPDATTGGSTSQQILCYDKIYDKWSRLEQTLQIIGVFESGQISSQNARNIPVIGGVNSSRVAGKFATDYQAAAGSNMAAVVETTEAQIFPGRRAFVQGVRPIIDGGADANITVQVGTRAAPNDSVTWGSAVAMNANGLSPQRSSSRFHRARINIAAGETWTHIQGVDVDARPEGRR